jgi:hypothetical protein
MLDHHTSRQMNSLTPQGKARPIKRVRGGADLGRLVVLAQGHGVEVPGDAQVHELRHTVGHPSSGPER